MPLPTHTSDPVFRRLEAAPDPRHFSGDNELALVGEGRRCTNYEALVCKRHKSALSALGEAARQARDLRSVLDDDLEIHSDSLRPT
ncbi:MAG: hypothetical protein BroJett014_09130 [Planctomycetota bacterium]|nr:hypothetical protein [Planctomycetota bacterium]GIK51940.1 MAG: hypothetical protein BroJett014_09130 [Planctomycetota bacterium]